MSGMLTRAGVARTFSTGVLKVVNNVAKQQFTVSLQGTNAALDYNKSGKNITFIETNVPDLFKGKGVGKLLAKHAFDYASANNLDVTCQCSFLAKFYEDNQSGYKNIKVKLDVEH